MVSQPLTDREFARVGMANRLVFASALEPAVGLDTTPTDRALPGVTVTLPAGIGININRVFAAISWRKQVNSSLVDNAVATTQQVQVREAVAGAFINAITVPAGALSTAGAATEGGMLIIGEQDISGEVDGDGTYEFQWQGAQADGDLLTLHDFQCLLLVEFT